MLQGNLLKQEGRYRTVAASLSRTSIMGQSFPAKWSKWGVDKVHGKRYL